MRVLARLSDGVVQKIGGPSHFKYPKGWNLIGNETPMKKSGVSSVTPIPVVTFKEDVAVEDRRDAHVERDLCGVRAGQLAAGQLGFVGEHAVEGGTASHDPGFCSLIARQV